MSTDPKVVDLQAARRAKRDKTGWTLEELRQKAKRDAEKYRHLGANEPANLASGVDMKKIISGAADRDEADKIERPHPLTEQEKQVLPMPGEVDPRDARRMATHFAAVEKLQLDATQRAWVTKNGSEVKVGGKK